MNKLNSQILFWGVLIWLVGYLLGILFFMIVPPSMIGWYVMPLGLVITWFVLLKKFKNKKYPEYVRTGLIWAIIAITLDYFFIVILLKPLDGYYKPDVYLYYLLTFVLPIVFGNLYKNKKIA